MTDFQASFRGCVIGDGTDIDVIAWEGLDLPEVRVGDVTRARRHGLIAGLDLAAGRRIRLILDAGAGSPAALDALLADLNAAFVVDEEEAEFRWQLPGQAERMVMARCRRRAFVVDQAFALGFAQQVAVELFATDPRIYASAESSASTGLPEDAGGLGFPAEAPFAFGTSGAGSTMACDNEGTFPTPWRATFAGPLVAPALEHVASGRVVSLPGASLASGEQLVVDSESRTVLLGGTASRYGWLAASSRWFDLEPGANAVRLSGASGSGTVTIRWRSAWL